MRKSFIFYHIYGSLHEPLHLELIQSLYKPLFGHRLVFVEEKAYIAGQRVCICVAKDTMLSQACIFATPLRIITKKYWSIEIGS